MIVDTVTLPSGAVVLGLKFEMPNAPLLVLRAEKGFVMCGYLDTAMAEALGDAACKVRGVNSFEDVLEAPVVEVTSAAEALGITTDMSGREALERMS